MARPNQLHQVDVCRHVAVGVHNPDCSPFAIQGRDVTVAPSGLAEIVSDDFPILHAGGLCLFCSRITAASPRRASGNGDRRAKSPIADGVLKALA